MTKLTKQEQTGRSMVEMLGVLAVIGVLSITGIYGYNTAMNKHKANEILDNASKRAVVVAGQIQLGNTSPTLEEFDTNTVQGVTYGNPYKLGDNQFAIPLDWSDITDQQETLCQYMQQYISEDGEDATAQIDTDCTRIAYNNDLSSGATSSNNTNYDSSTKKCKTGYYGDDCQNECTGDHKVVKNNACVCDEDNSYYADEEDSSQCVLDRCHQISCNEDQTCNPDDGQCVCNEAGQLSNGTSCVTVETSCPTESSSVNTEGSSTGKYVAVDGVATLCRCNGTKAYDGSAGCVAVETSCPTESSASNTTGGSTGKYVAVDGVATLCRCNGEKVYDGTAECVDVQSACPKGASTMYTATSTGKYINESGVAMLCGCDTDYTWTPNANNGAGECVDNSCSSKLEADCNNSDGQCSWYSGSCITLNNGCPTTGGETVCNDYMASGSYCVWYEAASTCTPVDPDNRACPKNATQELCAAYDAPWGSTCVWYDNQCWGLYYDCPVKVKTQELCEDNDAPWASTCVWNTSGGCVHT